MKERRRKKKISGNKRRKRLGTAIYERKRCGKKKSKWEMVFRTCIFSPYPVSLLRCAMVAPVKVHYTKYCKFNRNDEKEEKKHQSR